MTLREEITILCDNAKAAASRLALASTEQKNRVLTRLSEILTEESEALILANREDLETADANGVPKTMLDRLAINPPVSQGSVSPWRTWSPWRIPWGRERAGRVRRGL